jgi:TolB-like protein
MKKLLVFLFVLVGLTGIIFAQASITLDEAIAKGAQDIQDKLARGVKVVVLNFNSPTERFSNYVLDEMIGRLVNGGKVTVVDRQNLALIQKEMNFQMSGEVSDASAQEIGMKLGAQSIISGSLEDMGGFYRIRFRTIEVVSATIQVTSSLNVRKDSQVNILLSGVPASGATASTQRPATGSSGTGYPNGLNYSTERKVGAGFLNIFFGLGSFTMGDWAGGLIIAGAEIAGSLIMVNAINTDSYVEEWLEKTGHLPDEYYVGLAINIGSVIFGFVRPFAYDKALAKKNGTYYASSSPLDHINIVLIPNDNGIRAVHLSYNLKF